MYLGLSRALVALAVKFFQEAAHTLTGIFALTETDLVLTALSLIDIVLVGSLIVMVMLSGCCSACSIGWRSPLTGTPERTPAKVSGHPQPIRRMPVGPLLWFNPGTPLRPIAHPGKLERDRPFSLSSGRRELVQQNV